MSERRHYPRLHADVLWRSAGLRAPQRPVADMSLSGVRVYSDELVPIGDRLQLQLMLPDEAPIELLARVVRVHILPPSGPAFCDVSLEFLTMTGEARRLLEKRLSPPSRATCHSQPRVHEHHCHEVDHVEDQHREECLREPSTCAALARGPDGDRHVCDQDGDEDELLHRTFH
jgi:hypothetical protein